MAQFLPFSSATINLDQVTHITRNNQSLQFHLTSGNMIQIEVPGRWSTYDTENFILSPQRAMLNSDGILCPNP